ncbi:hypothetical protein [Bacillus sp. FSL K6-1003]
MNRRKADGHRVPSAFFSQNTLNVFCLFKRNDSGKTTTNTN